MIIDRIENVKNYENLNNKVKNALDFIASRNFSECESGDFEIDGDVVFGMIQEYDTRKREHGKWEAHRRYIDIHYIISGTEQAGYSNRNNMKIVQEYNDEDDFMLLEGQGSFITMNRGDFAIFWPEDAHMPGQAINIPDTVKKMVVKIKI